MAARATRVAWQDVPLEAAPLGLPLTLGIGSGMSRRPAAAPGRVFAVTDRGPNLFISQVLEMGLRQFEPLRSLAGAKVMPAPEMGPEIAELEITGGAMRLVRRIPLQTQSGRRLMGSAPEGLAMEPLFGLDGAPLAPVPLGVDTEAIAALPDGGFFVAEEYVPSLLKVSADGVVSERWIPPGMEACIAHPEIAVRSVLPEGMGRRRPNRGLEALCVSPDGRHLYLGLQSAAEGDDPSYAPVWKLDANTGHRLGEYRYAFDPPQAFRRDAERRAVTGADLKICEFAWLGEDRLLVLERIAHTTKLYAADLASGRKQLVMSSDTLREIGPDMEAMTLLSDREILLASDNDFSVEGALTEAWLVTLDEAI